MSNLPKFIALEKLVQGLGHGRVDLSMQVRAGKIATVLTTGSKRTLYNSSEKDINTNQKALEYIVKRIAQQLETGVSAELVFRVQSAKDRIKVIEVESTQTIA